MRHHFRDLRFFFFNLFYPSFVHLKWFIGGRKEIEMCNKIITFLTTFILHQIKCKCNVVACIFTIRYIVRDFKSQQLDEIFIFIGIGNVNSTELELTVCMTILDARESSVSLLKKNLFRCYKIVKTLCDHISTS